MGLAPARRFMGWDEFLEYVHSGERELVIREICRALIDQESFEFDMRFMHDAERSRWVRVRGIPRSEKDGSRYLTGAVFDITERKHLEDKVVGIRESQRLEIGQILHDDIGQQITGITLLAESLTGLLESKGLVPEAEKARVLADHSMRALDDLRRVARNLYPVQITPDGFSDALTSLAYDAQAMSGIECVFENRCDEPALNNAQATQLYYIAREAVNNAIKHSHAKRIRIGVMKEDGIVTVSVEDDGCGFDMAAHGKGIGMDIMQFRANQFNGDFQAVSAPGTGTCVRISVKEDLREKEQQN